MNTQRQPKPVTDPLWRRIQETHEGALRAAGDTITKALACGGLLLKAHDQTPNGEWQMRLDAIGLNRMTANRYMRLVEKFNAAKRQLGDGITLTDLYRDFGLVAPTTGGGRRLGDSELERRKFDPVYQLRRHFDDFSGWLEKLDKCGEFNPFTAAAEEEAEKVDLEATERRLERALDLVRDARAQAGAIAVEGSQRTEELETV